MKVLVATREKQGKRASDFFFAEEGELVSLGFECDKDANLDVDKGCGCQRSVVGFDSHRGCTTFKVEDRPISKSEYVGALQRSSDDIGWNHSVRKEALELLEWASRFEVGALLEKRGPEIKVRAN